MATTLLLLRHGETNWNIEHRTQGLTNNSLNKTGIKQIQELAHNIKKEAWDSIISSDLLRAQQSASIIASELGISLTFMKELRERCHGILEGKTEYPNINFSSFIENRESFLLFTRRIISGINNILDMNNDKRVIIVTHGEAIRVLLSTKIKQNAERI